MAALPRFHGWTVDFRLHQFRRSSLSSGMVFLSFESPMGRSLLAWMETGKRQRRPVKTWASKVPLRTFLIPVRREERWICTGTVAVHAPNKRAALAKLEQGPNDYDVIDGFTNDFDESLTVWAFDPSYDVREAD